MRAARPCLVGGDAGVEVVNPPEAGLSVDPSDARSLVTALVRLLTPGPEWDGMAAGARSRYAAHFTAQHFQERLLSALERLA
jgi:glycosyltransferase involved in cell wall biosynthesis